MKTFRAAVGSLTGIICAGVLQSCGGGYHAGSGSMTPTSISISVNPTTVIAGRSTTLMWSATGGTATHLDPNLVNPWGLSIPGAASTAPAWVSNQGKQTSTLYDGNGVPQPAAGPLIVNLAAGLGAVPFDPTGIVANGSTADFVVTASGNALLVGGLVDTNSTANGAPGLLGIAFGNDAANQPHNTLFFASGINSGADGVYGRVDLTTL
jgi:hypothetical protein